MATAVPVGHRDACAVHQTVLLSCGSAPIIETGLEPAAKMRPENNWNCPDWTKTNQCRQRLDTCPFNGASLDWMALKSDYAPLLSDRGPPRRWCFGAAASEAFGEHPIRSRIVCGTKFEI